MKRKERELEKELINVVQDIRSLADAVEVLYLTADDDKAGNADHIAVTPQPEMSFEELRKALADKSRKGKTEEVRELILKYGADRLSAVDPSRYADLLKDAEGL